MDKPSQTLTIIHPDGRIETREPAGKKWTLEELQAAIGGGYIERLLFPGHNSNVAIFDEEGQLKGQALNPEASRLAGRPLVGIVAFGHKSVLR